VLDSRRARKKEPSGLLISPGRDTRMTRFASGVCPPTEAVDVGHSDSPTAGDSEGPGDRVVRSSAAVSSRSASAAASFNQAGSLPGASKIALLIASRAVDASLHPLVPLLRASQNHVQELPRLRLRISWRATSTSPRGVTTVTVSDRLRTALPAGISFRAYSCAELAASGREILPPPSCTESRATHWLQVPPDRPLDGITGPFQTIRRPPAHRLGVALCRRSASAAQQRRNMNAIVPALRAGGSGLAERSASGATELTAPSGGKQSRGIAVTRDPITPIATTPASWLLRAGSGSLERHDRGLRECPCFVEAGL
jgi:hypothetical protein